MLHNMSRFIIHPGNVIPPPKPKAQPKAATLVGRTVMFKSSEVGSEGLAIAGVVQAQDGGVLTVALALPNSDGVLVVCKEALVHTLVEHCTPFEATVKAGTVKQWHSSQPIAGTKSTQVVTDDASGKVLDYHGVTFEGYASTFVGTTPKDRDGDNILPGAFDKSLKRFSENPVMLTDHARMVGHMMGHYEKIGTNERGLFMTGKVTDSPHPDAQHVRFLVAEGSLKTLSIGGGLFYLEDYKTIAEADLHETSLVVIPANPDATVMAKSIDASFAAKAYTLHTHRNGGELRAKNS
jgi:HK97 family phage prohead protease